MKHNLDIQNIINDSPDYKEKDCFELFKLKDGLIITKLVEKLSDSEDIMYIAEVKIGRDAIKIANGFTEEELKDNIDKFLASFNNVQKILRVKEL